jgi:RecA-family ATPase
MREEDLSFNSNYIKTLISLVEVCIMLSGGRHMVGEMKNDEGIYIIKVIMAILFRPSDIAL